MEAFRDTLPLGSGAQPTADQLCAIGYCLHLAKGEQLAPDARDDRLVFIASGSGMRSSRAQVP